MQQLLRRLRHHFRLRTFAAASGVAAVFLFLLFLLLNALFPLPLQVPYSTVVTASDGSVLHAFLSPDDKWRMQLTQEEVNPALKQAVLQKEDKYFYYHPGVNVLAVGRALLKNAVRGKKTSGASTITMQVARLLQPKERTYGNKIVEMFRALQLEWQLPKDEILLLYLNLVPYGGNIEGVKAAALLYFRQPPGKLSLAEAVTLAVIPNKPSSLRLGHNNSAIKAFRNRWLQQFRQENIFPKEAVEDALLEPLQARRHPAPQLAPHLALRLRRQFRQQNTIRSTLSRTAQHKAETIVFNYMKRLRSHNISNAAVLVLDNKTKAVVAYVGSADFHDHSAAGQVDGIRAVRSPGSTLKPFLYATAIDRGLLTPKTIISDVPVDFGGYRPENYFAKFNGNVTVQQALAQSLNIPAVKALDQLTVPVFTEQLKKANFRSVKQKEKLLGLSLVLGGCGATLEELTNLYASFANSGQYSPIRWLQNGTASRPDSTRLMSAAAAYMITETLTQLTRPDLPRQASQAAHLPRIAWKTGTSYGRRDAWSIGYNQRYTIGVWVGNFSGEGVPELNGTDTATPLLFELFNTLDYKPKEEWFFAPKELKFRYVCAESGRLPNDFCQNQVMDYFIPNVSEGLQCQHLKPVQVSADERFSYCPACLPLNGYKQLLYPNLPPELLAFLRHEQVPVQEIPPHHPACSRIAEENAPVITSPAAGAEYLLLAGEDQKLLLRCQAENTVKQVYWYVDDVFFKSATVGESVFITPRQPGTLKISCTDDHGRNTNVQVLVRFI